MKSGTRLPTWKERENNKRRERRRRAVAAKIYSGLRMYGNFKLPKHCDNNEVLKALCRDVGWIVEEDGTTYRKGWKPVERMYMVGGASASPPCSSSYNPSPCLSYNPSPASSSFASPASSSYITNANIANATADANSLIPWLKNLSSVSSSASSKAVNHQNLHRHCIRGGSISAPVTPLLSSPTARSPRRLKRNCWVEGGGGSNYGFQPSSTPPSPCHQLVPDCGWVSGSLASSPTFSLVSSNPNPFGFCKDAVMWSPGQSGSCSPAMPGVPGIGDVHMSDGASHEFAFGSSSNGNIPMSVKAWAGERIHEECCGSDDLELTLGSSQTRSNAC